MIVLQRFHEEDEEKQGIVVDAPHPVGRVAFLHVDLPTHFSKVVALYIRNQFRNWEYQDTIDGWDKEKTNRALLDYKKFMLVMTNALASGALLKQGIFKSLKLLHLFELFIEIKKIKNDEMSEVPDKIKEPIEEYMRSVFPIEKKIIQHFADRGFFNQEGRLIHLNRILEYLGKISVREFLTQDQEKKQEK